MGKKEQQTVEELRATVSFLTSARSVLIGERDKFVAQMKDQSVLIGELDKVAKKMVAERDDLRIYLKRANESSKQRAGEHLKTFQSLNNERDAVDRRNLVIFILSVPYLIAVVSFLCHHLSVSLH